MISIIIPAYNAAETICNTIESILKQSYDNWELIIVNDGSTDNTAKVISDISEKDQRIKIFHQNNKGAFAARLYGITNASGEWLTFVDADDTLPIDSLANLINSENSKCDIIIGKLNLNNSKQFVHSLNGITCIPDYIVALFLWQTTIGLCGKIFRTELFQDIDFDAIRIDQNEDFLMLLLIAIKSKRVFIDNNIISYNYIYRRNSASRQSMVINKWFSLFHKINNIIAPFANESIHNAFIHYKLRIILKACILENQDLSHYHDQLHSIRKEAKSINLSITEKYTLWLIKFPMLSRITGNTFQFAKRMKHKFTK